MYFSDPPLSEEDIPNGQWLCHNCRMTLRLPPATLTKSNSVERLTNLTRSSSLNSAAGINETEQLIASRPNTPIIIESDSSSSTAAAAFYKIRNLRKRSSSQISGSSENNAAVSSTINNGGSNNSNVVEKVEKIPIYAHKISNTIVKALDPNRKPTPLDELIRAASVMNPKQFELPKELELHCQFPGSDKSKFVAFS